MQYCIYKVRFTWDAEKDRGNRRKHGISFDIAARVFLDPFHLSRHDRVVEDEARWQTIGMVDGVLLVLVAYSVVDEEEEAIRIISARKVTRQERIEYEEANKV
ncbi:MAG: BrnT family toxin [Acidobacteriaceae bacterium]